MYRFLRCLVLVVVLVSFAVPVRNAAAAAGPDVRTGKIGGVPYRVEVPQRWNGTLVLWSHGAYGLELPPPTEIALTNHPVTRQWLLDQGYALAASQYRVVQGFTVVEAGLKDQIDLLDWFEDNVGKPKRTVSAGASAGGLIATLLAERNPRRFDGLASFCGLQAGTTGHFNSALDANFAVKTLLAPELEMVRLKDPAANATAARKVIQDVVDSGDAGKRARFALAQALANVPGRYASRAATPSSVVDQVRNLYYYAYYDRGGYWGVTRADIEKRAGGNPSWNTGVDYRRLFARSSQKSLVKQAYEEAGLSLRNDLRRLNAAPRVKADRRAVAYLDRYGTPSGGTPWPVVTLHSVADGSVPASNHQWYAGQVRRPEMLRQLYVDRGYHCTFTASEELTTMRTLLGRMDTGRWSSTRPDTLNKLAGAYGPGFQTVFDFDPEAGYHATQPAFIRHRPGRYLRP